ncbi:aspartic protease 2B [Aphelenchoides avenae]|nr:aspartic protease 2B [Aphelenchus avenae]
MMRQTEVVVGIGPNAANPKGVDSPIVTAFKQGLIEKPVATLWSGKTKDEGWGPHTAGELTYGGVDEAKCGPVTTYHPIATAKADNGLGWYVKASVSIGTATVNVNQLQFDFSSGAGFMFADDAYETQLLGGITGPKVGPWFDCKLTSTFNFTLTIDGHDYVVPGDEVVERDEKDNTCSLLFEGEGAPGQFILGEQFLQKYCHSFDIGNNAIGFSKNLVQN